MQIHLSDHFTYSKLLRFTAPSVTTMVFLSIYGMIDGLFVSNCAGEAPFAAVNLIFPFLMLLGSFGALLGTGGSAIVSILLGEGEAERANRCFSMFIEVAVALGLLFAVAGWFAMPLVSRLLGAEGEVLEYCVIYGRILCWSSVPFLLQNVMQTYFVAAEKPNLGLLVSVAAGCANILFDWLLVAVFPLGIYGAAAATAISQTVGGFLSLAWFLRPQGGLLRLSPAPVDFPLLLRACVNGSSEMVTNLSLSLVNMLYNLRLMQMAGDAGVAAYGVVMYVNFIFISAFIGYSFGSAPLFGYHYGAQNDAELQSLFRKSHVLLLATGTAMTALALAASGWLSQIFVGYNAALFAMTRRAFRLYSCAFLLMGFNIFASGFFTALGNGPVSAALSFSRLLLFQVVCVAVLPELLGLDGVWLSNLAAEGLSLACSYLAVVALRSRYRYL